jgi:hypothetical protein
MSTLDDCSAGNLQTIKTQNGSRLQEVRDRKISVAPKGVDITSGSGGPRVEGRDLSARQAIVGDAKSSKCEILEKVLNFLRELFNLDTNKTLQNTKVNSTADDLNKIATETIDKINASGHNAFALCDSIDSIKKTFEQLKEVKRILIELADGNQELQEKVNGAIGNQIEYLCGKLGDLDLFNGCDTTKSINEQLEQLKTLKDELTRLADGNPGTTEKVNGAIGNQIEHLCGKLDELDPLDGCITEYSIDKRLEQLKTLKESLKGLAGDNPEMSGKVNEAMGKLIERLWDSLKGKYETRMGNITTIESLKNEVSSGIAYHIQHLREIASGLVDDDELNKKIQEEIGGVVGTKANALVKKMSERCSPEYGGTDKITTVEQLQNEITKQDGLEDLSIAMCNCFFGNSTIKENENSYAQSNSFSEFYRTALAIANMADDTTVENALQIKINAGEASSEKILKEARDTIQQACLSLAKHVEQHKGSQIEAIISPISAMISDQIRQQTDKAINIAEVIMGIYNVCTSYNANPGATQANEVVKRVLELTENLSSDEKQAIYDTLSQETKDIIMFIVMGAIAEMSSNAASESGSITKDDIVFLAQVIKLSHLFPELKQRSSASLLECLQAVVDHAQDLDRDTLRTIATAAVSSLNTTKTGTNIEEDNLISMLKLIKISGLSILNLSQDHPEGMKAINEYCRKFLSDKIDTREHFAEFLKEDGNLEKFTLMASFLCANSADGGLFGLNSLKDALQIGTVSMTPVGQAIKSGTQVAEGQVKNGGLLGMIVDERDTFEINFLISLLEIPEDKLATITNDMLNGNGQFTFEWVLQILCMIQAAHIWMRAGKKQLPSLTNLNETQKPLFDRIREKLQNIGPMDVQATLNIIKLHLNGTVELPDLELAMTSAALDSLIKNLTETLRKSSVTALGGNGGLLQKMQQMQAMREIVESVGNSDKSKGILLQSLLKHLGDGISSFEAAIDEKIEQLQKIQNEQFESVLKAVVDEQGQQKSDGGILSKLTAFVSKPQITFGSEYKTIEQRMAVYVQQFASLNGISEEEAETSLRMAIVTQILIGKKGPFGGKGSLNDTEFAFLYNQSSLSAEATEDFVKNYPLEGLSPEDEIKALELCWKVVREQNNRDEMIADLTNLKMNPA